MFVTCLLRCAEFGISMSAMVFFVLYLGGTMTTVGGLVSVYMLVRILATPSWAILSDRIGKKIVLYLQLLGLISSMLIMAAATSTEWIWVARFLAGVFSAGMATLTSIMLEQVESLDERAHVIAAIEASATCGGLIIGPVLGGVAFTISPRAPFLLASLLLLIGLPCVKVGVLSLKPVIKLGDAGTSWLRNLREAVFRLPKTNSARGAVVCVFLFSLGWASIEACLAQFLRASQGRDNITVVALLAVIGIAGAISQFWLVRPLLNRVSPPLAFFMGNALLAISLAGVSLIDRYLPSSRLAIPLDLFLLGLGGSVIFPVLGSLVAIRAFATELATLQGLLRTYNALGIFIFAPIAGYLFQHLSIGAPFYVGAVLFFLAGGFALVWRWRIPQLMSQNEVDSLFAPKKASI